MYIKFYLTILIFSIIFSQVLLQNDNNGRDKDKGKGKSKGKGKGKGKPVNKKEMKDNDFDINQASTSTRITSNSERKLPTDGNLKCNPYLERRPRHHANLPSMKITFNGVQYQAARHHIIECNILVDFVNTLEAEDPTTEFGRYVENWLMEIVYHFMCNQHMGELLQDRLQRESGQPINLEGLNEAELDGEFAKAKERFARLLCWPTGLIFIAMEPGLRGDDPGNGMEKGARYIIGDKLFEDACLVRDLILYYIRYPMYRNINTLGLIRQFLTPFLLRDTPWMYNEYQWILKRKYDKKKNPVFDKNGEPVYEFHIRKSDEYVEGPTDNHKRKGDDGNDDEPGPSNKSKRSVDIISNEINPLEFYYNTECDSKGCRTLEEMIDQYYIDCQFDYY